jgi:hypothetical protein
MREVFEDVSFDNEDMHCPSCGWHGKGDETRIIDFYGVSSNREVHCPNCDSYLGVVKKSRGPGGGTAGPVSFQF